MHVRILCSLAAAHKANFRAHIQPPVLVINRSGAEMQFARDPITEIANLALGLVRGVIADMAHPGRLFHLAS